MIQNKSNFISTCCFL